VQSLYDRLANIALKLQLGELSIILLKIGVNFHPAQRLHTNKVCQQRDRNEALSALSLSPVLALLFDNSICVQSVEAFIF
jgi:hypothetical protein